MKQLTDEQIATMTLEEKDRWWLTEVYRGHEPQLTIRSAIVGMFLGGILSLTNLYIGIKTGWTLGVGITSVIISFAFFKMMSHFKLGSEITLLENNAMQSIATAAGYMTGPLVSSISAYMLITQKIIPMHQTIIWLILLSILGVLYAFPLKKRFINDEQLPFPEGRASGIVMENLHTGTGAEGTFKVKILAVGAGLAALIEFLRNEPILNSVKLKFLNLPQFWDDLIYKFWTPQIMGTPLKDLTIRMDTSIVMMATGGLMGTKTAASLVLGAVINYVILAPIMIQKGVIQGVGFKHITMWALWGGVAMMTTSSLLSFFSKPKMIIDSFTRLFKKKGERKEDILKDIELPLWVSIVFIPIVGGLAVYTSHRFFGLAIWEGIIAIPLVFVFTLIAVYSTGLTAITPTGALGKLTQLSYAAIAPGNIQTNIVAAGINGEVAGNASNLLMDIKPGYMLGAKPRQQAVGHILGIFAGGFVSVPVFYLLFNGNVNLLTSDQLPLPSAQIWRAVADVLIKGIHSLHPSAQIAVMVGAVLGILVEIANIRSKGKFPISAMGVGLAFVLPFWDAWAMGVGAFIFWFAGKKLKNKESTAHKVFIDNQETACAGVIAGGAIIGIMLTVIETLFIHS